MRSVDSAYHQTKGYHIHATSTVPLCGALPVSDPEACLDCSRRGEFQNFTRHKNGECKRFIDLISCYKMNIMHLHLTDDQGWRIEIKSWPQLTEVGGSTQVGGGGGFDTQEHYREIEGHARSRYVMLLPEIDTPGHTNAALASYPELNCSGKAPKLYEGIEVGFSTLCIGKDITYQFLGAVIRALASLTPTSYIHTYVWEPGSHVDGLEESNILGIEAPLWIETILTGKDVEFMVFPRILGIAELPWSPEGRCCEEYR